MTKRIYIVTLVIESDAPELMDDQIHEDLCVKLNEEQVLDTDQYTVTNVTSVTEITGE